MRSINLLAVAVVTVATTWHVSAQQAAPRAIGRAAAPRAAGSSAALLPGTSQNVLATVQGTALDSTNAAMPDTAVRLRDARTGRIIETTVTDKTGNFTFGNVDPGSYIVELIAFDQQQTLLAASQIIHANAGEAVATVVRLPFKVPPFGGVFGSSVPSAAAIMAQAAAAGVLAAEVSGAPISER